MFTKIIIKNVLGINNEISLDFIAEPKKKEGKNTVSEIDQFVNVDKIVGIIGSNSSGKSSIVQTINELGCFLAQYQIVDEAQKDNDEKSQHFLKMFKNELLPERNLEKINEESKIELEMFIPKGEMPGIYTYTLIYDDNKLNEVLNFRKKYKSKKILEIENYKTDTKRSDIGYKCFYKDNILKDYEQVGKQLVDKFNDTMKYYKTFYNYYIKDSILQTRPYDVDYLYEEEMQEWINNDKEILLKLLKLVDYKIEDVFIEKDNDGDDMVKFTTTKGIKLDPWQLSSGTKRMIKLLYRTINTIKNNGVMICDEIETALHKELVQLIINLYMTSNKYAQLIFTTHIPEILDRGKMRNDQKFYLDNDNGNVEIKKISNINSRLDFSVSKNYYEDKKLSPQPSEEQIEEFCELLKNKIL